MSKAAAVKATMRGPSWAEILHLTKEICGMFVRHPCEWQLYTYSSYRILTDWLMLMKS